MTTVRIQAELYLRLLRVLGAWWRLGSSVLEPQLLVQGALARGGDAAEPDLATPDSVVRTS